MPPKIIAIQAKDDDRQDQVLSTRGFNRIRFQSIRKNAQLTANKQMCFIEQNI